MRPGSTLVGLLESGQIRAVADGSRRPHPRRGRGGPALGLPDRHANAPCARRARARGRHAPGRCEPRRARLVGEPGRGGLGADCRRSSTCPGRGATTRPSGSGRTSARVTTSRASRCASRCTRLVRAAAWDPPRSRSGRRSSRVGVPRAAAPARALSTHDLGRYGGRRSSPTRPSSASNAGETLVALARVEGAWYAVEAWCTHAECPLRTAGSRARRSAARATASLFDLASGEPLEGPADEPVRVYRTRVVGDRVEVEMR